MDAFYASAPLERRLSRRIVPVVLIVVLCLAGVSHPVEGHAMESGGTLDDPHGGVGMPDAHRLSSRHARGLMIEPPIGKRDRIWTRPEGMVYRPQRPGIRGSIAQQHASERSLIHPPVGEGIEDPLATSDERRGADSTPRGT